MTIKELKEIIKDMNDDQIVLIPHDEFGGYYSPKTSEFKIKEVYEVKTDHWTDMPYQDIENIKTIFNPEDIISKQKALII